MGLKASSLTRKDAFSPNCVYKYIYSKKVNPDLWV